MKKKRAGVSVGFFLARSMLVHAEPLGGHLMYFWIARVTPVQDSPLGEDFPALAR